jgi:hypothetical protein
MVNYLKKHLHWIIAGVVIFAVVLSILIQIFSKEICPEYMPWYQCVTYQIFEYLNEWALVLSASATFILAGAAFLTIHNSNEREKRRREEELTREERDRKERLLNEIIEWVIDISKGDFDRDMDSLITTIEAARQEAQVNLDEYKQFSAQIIGKNNYIVKIASDIDSDLTDSVKQLDKLLRKRFEMTIPYLRQRDTTVFLPIKNKLQIYELTNDIIEKAVKLL